MLHGQLLPFWRIMHLILCSTIDPKKHTTELSYGRAEFLYMVVVRGLHVDMASFIYQCVRAEALKTDAQISLPYGVLLTQFLHNLMVPEGADEPRALPLGSINKTTLSKSMAQTRRVLGAARAARARREEPAQGTEEQDLGQGSSQGLEGQRPSWVASMMTELTEQMRAVMQPTHEMVGNISSRLSALELKVVSMDAELKKQVSEVQLALKSVATSAELVALTERVVLLEEHMSDVRAVLHLSDD
ncbi:hypothetical protein CJ030_MR0G013875 [Morella rubra]|uniref:Uncharacterized protein n=2 Tax=Morella rubra TaxID=262757 RepID=A0A6A1UHV7_9ROSI|nr:hypothetical protein CJ030_MR0G013875 [Morella rubra]